MSEEQFDYDLLCLDLSCQSSQTRLVFIGGSADRQLLSKLFRQLALQLQRRLVV